MVLLPDVKPEAGPALQAQHAESDEDGGRVQPRHATACVFPGIDQSIGDVDSIAPHCIITHCWGVCCILYHTQGMPVLFGRFDIGHKLDGSGGIRRDLNARNR